MKKLYYPLAAALALCLVISAMAFVNAKKDQPDKHLEIVLRNIGHQLLLHSGDSTSRVLPIKAVSEHSFRISFETHFRFVPDTLMSIVDRQLSATGHAGKYIVSVNECDHGQTVFAFEVDKVNGDLLACRGRMMKTGCYTVEITFPGENGFDYRWLLTGLVPLGLLGLYFSRKKKQPATTAVLYGNGDQPASHTPAIASTPAQPNTSATETTDNPEPPDTPETHKNHQTIPNPEAPSVLCVGNFQFDEAKGALRIDNQVIQLSDKEVKVLRLFTAHPGQVVERDTMMKIWEDDGVVVIARNADVLVSKLRKKLAADPSIKIVNVFGKGYKLLC